MSTRMTYRPAADERSVLPLPGARTKERIYLREIGQYLHHPMASLRRFAKKEGLLRKVGLGGAHKGVEYVTPYGAMRVIAYARAIEGEYYLRGKHFHEFNEYEALEVKERRRRVGRVYRSAAVRSLGLARRLAK